MAEERRTFLELARHSFLALIVSLAWMKPVISIGGLGVVPADALFLLAGVAWVIAMLRGETAIRWHPAFWLLLTYFGALAVSVTQSADLQRSLFKLATQAYLLSLPVLAFQLVGTWKDLARVFRAWLAASCVLAILATAVIVLFALFDRAPAIEPMLHDYGTLPPGPYPRLELTFEYPAMLANYLATSLVILLIARQLGLIGSITLWLLGVGISLAAFFALTPGFGGYIAAGAAMMWLLFRASAPGLARSALVAGVLATAASILVAAVAPIIHPTAPFLIEIPATTITVAPSVRLLAWMDALQHFLASPIAGIGIGLDTANVDYLTPQGALAHVSDAHNAFLSIAAASGALGLIALGAVVVAAVRIGTHASNVAAQGLATGFVAGIGIQGLVGSFEDARHLWIIFGLLAVCSTLGQRLDSREGSQALGSSAAKAIRRASDRLRTPSLAIRLARWISTVRALIPRS